MIRNFPLTADERRHQRLIGDLQEEEGSRKVRWCEEHDSVADNDVLVCHASEAYTFAGESVAPCRLVEKQLVSVGVTPEEIRVCLENAVQFWRERQLAGYPHDAVCYIDALQGVLLTVFDQVGE